MEQVAVRRGPPRRGRVASHRRHHPLLGGTRIDYTWCRGFDRGCTVAGSFSSPLKNLLDRRGILGTSSLLKRKRGRESFSGATGRPLGRPNSHTAFDSQLPGGFDLPVGVAERCPSLLPAGALRVPPGFPLAGRIPTTLSVPAPARASAMRPGCGAAGAKDWTNATARLDSPDRHATGFAPHSDRRPGNGRPLESGKT